MSEVKLLNVADELLELDCCDVTEYAISVNTWCEWMPFCEWCTEIAETRGWHIQEKLLDEYQLFAKYATLEYLRSEGVEAIDEYYFDELMDGIYQEQSSVCLEDIKRHYWYFVELGGAEHILWSEEWLEQQKRNELVAQSQNQSKSRGKGR